MSTPLIDNVFHITDQQNRPVPGGQVYTYEEDTTNPKATYSDELSTPNSNPVILDAAGKAQIYGSGRYTVNVLDALGAQVAGWPKVIEALGAGGTTSAGTTNGIYFLNNSDVITDHGAASGASYEAQNLQWIIDTLAGGAGTVIVPAGDYTFITGMTTPGNVSIFALNGARISVLGSLELGAFNAPRHCEQIFYGDGGPADVTFSAAACARIYASWFGSVTAAMAASGTTKIPVSVDGAYSVGDGVMMPDGGELTADYIGAGIITSSGAVNPVLFPEIYENMISVTKLIINITTTMEHAAGVVITKSNGGFNVSGNIVNVLASNQYGIMCDGFTGVEKEAINLLSINQFNLLDATDKAVVITDGTAVIETLPEMLWASQAEVNAGLLSNKTLNPVTFVDSFKPDITDRSVPLPGGFVLQFGIVTASEDAWSYHTLPVPYLSENDYCIVGSGSSGMMGADTDVQLDVHSGEQFKVISNAYGVYGGKIRWFAIGRAKAR